MDLTIRRNCDNILKMSASHKKKNSAYVLNIRSSLQKVRRGSITLSSLVKKSVKNQYRRSVLGILWTVLNPLLNMLVMTFVFSSIFGRDGIDMDYPVYVLSGNIVFSLVSAATTNAMTSIVGNYDLLYKTRVPYSVFPLSQVFTQVVNFMFSLVALVIVMLIRIPSGVTFHWSMFMILLPWLPAILLFTIGMSYLLCTIYVRFRDIKHIWSVVVRLWMYLTPVFYSLSALDLGDTAMQIMRLNPMLHYLNYFRDVIIGSVPGWEAHAICYGVGIGFFTIGWLLFRLSRNRFILNI